jgi:hypothetical protein
MWENEHCRRKLKCGRRRRRKEEQERRKKERKKKIMNYKSLFSQRNM